MFRVIPFPAQVKGMEGRFILIQPEKGFTVNDNIKRFYAKLEQADIRQCKRIQVIELICKQDFPLFSSHSSRDCEVLMLQSIPVMGKLFKEGAKGKEKNFRRANIIY